MYFIIYTYVLLGQIILNFTVLSVTDIYKYRLP